MSNTVKRPKVVVPDSMSEESLAEFCRQTDRALIEAGALVGRDLYGRLVTVREIKRPAVTPHSTEVTPRGDRR
jgi:hypothetical protein